MLRTMKIALVGAIVLASTAMVSAQNANRLDRGYNSPAYNFNPNLNKGTGESGGGGS